MVDFGSEQGLSDFETAGIAGYVEDFKRAKTPLRAKRCRLWMDTNYVTICAMTGTGVQSIAVANPFCNLIYKFYVDWK